MDLPGHVPQSSSEKATDIVGCLQRSNAQTFIDMTDEVSYRSFVLGESSD